MSISVREERTRYNPNLSEEEPLFNASTINPGSAPVMPQIPAETWGTWIRTKIDGVRVRDHLLPPPAKVRRVTHHAAMAYANVPAFMARLNERTEIASKALAFTILTACRTNEVLSATHGLRSIGRPVHG